MHLERAARLGPVDRAALIAAVAPTGRGGLRGRRGAEEARRPAELSVLGVDGGGRLAGAAGAGGDLVRDAAAQGWQLAVAHVPRAGGLVGVAVPEDDVHRDLGALFVLRGATTPRGQHLFAQRVGAVQRQLPREQVTHGGQRGGRRRHRGVRPDHRHARRPGVETTGVSSDDGPLQAAVAAFVDAAELVDEEVVADVVPAQALRVVGVEAAHLLGRLVGGVIVGRRRVMDVGHLHVRGVRRLALAQALVRAPLGPADDGRPPRRRDRGRQRRRDLPQRRVRRRLTRVHELDPDGARRPPGWHVYPHLDTVSLADPGGGGAGPHPGSQRLRRDVVRSLVGGDLQWRPGRPALVAAGARRDHDGAGAAVLRPGDTERREGPGRRPSGQQERPAPAGRGAGVGGERGRVDPRHRQRLHRRGHGTGRRPPRRRRHRQRQHGRDQHGEQTHGGEMSHRKTPRSCNACGCWYRCDTASTGAMYVLQQVSSSLLPTLSASATPLSPVLVGPGPGSAAERIRR